MSHRKFRASLPALLLLFLICGCGQKVSQPVAPIATTLGPDTAKAVIVLLPFTDYSSGERLDNPLRRQVKIHESLTYRLVQYGYYTPIEEDVMQYLSDMGVSIAGPTAGLDDAARRTVEREMAAGWSESMKGKINDMIQENEQGNAAIPGLRNDVGLNTSVLRNIGRHFGADYVLRGRIIEYAFSKNRETAIVELGLVLQDVKSGRVVWANRVREKVAYNCLWGEPTRHDEIDSAIELASQAIVKDLAETFERLPVNNEDAEVAEVGRNPLPRVNKNTQKVMEEPVDTFKGKERENPSHWGS